MTKQEFLCEIRRNLCGLPEEDIRPSLDFYREMLDDRMEDGLSEEEAVAALGAPEAIAAHIRLEIADDRERERETTKAAEENLYPSEKDGRSSGMTVGVVIALILGFPLWFPLLLVAAVLVAVLFLLLWVADLLLWSADLLFAAAVLAFSFGGIYCLIEGEIGAGVFLLGSGAVCAGLTLLCFPLCSAITKGIAALCKKTGRGIVRILRKKRRNSK